MILYNSKCTFVNFKKKIMEFNHTEMTIISLIVIILMITFLYIFVQKSNKKEEEKEEEQILLEINFETNLSVSEEEDFKWYIKKYAQEKNLSKKDLLIDLTKNKFVLVNSYEKHTGRKIPKDQNLFLTFIKIFNDY